MDTTKYLIGHLPIDNKLLRDVSFPHPFLRDSKHGSQAFHRLAVMMPTISDEEVSLVMAKWKLYQTGQVDSESATRRKIQIQKVPRGPLLDRCVPREIARG